MPAIEHQRLRHVEAVMNYHEDTGERPAHYLYETRPGYTPPPPPNVKHTVEIADARPVEDRFTLDNNGFCYVHSPLPALDFRDPEAVADGYYAIACELVRQATGASRVEAFDHNVRDKALAAEPGSGVRTPVRFVHNDYTEVSAPQRVRDLMGDEAESLLEHRYAFINVWRPLRGPVEDVPLGICDAASIAPDDFIATDLRYADRTGEIYSVRYSERHRWYFLGGMQPEEVMLIKCFDAAEDGRARYTAHSGFRDPAAGEDALPRRSIEVRTIAFF